MSFLPVVDLPSAEGNSHALNIAPRPGAGGPDRGGGRNSRRRQNVHVNPPGTSGGRGVARNVHAAGFHPEHNGPEERFSDLDGVYQAIGGLPEALSNYFNAGPPAPWCRLIDVARDYHEANSFRVEAPDEGEREFMSSVLNSLRAEKDVLVSSQSPNSTEAGGASEEGVSGDGN